MQVRPCGCINSTDVLRLKINNNTPKSDTVSEEKPVRLQQKSGHNAYNPLRSRGQVHVCFSENGTDAYLFPQENCSMHIKLPAELKKNKNQLNKLKNYPVSPKF